MATEAEGPTGVSLACPGQDMSTLGRRAHGKASNLPKLETWLTQHQGRGWGGEGRGGTLEESSINPICMVLRTIPDAVERAL